LYYEIGKEKSEEQKVVTDTLIREAEREEEHHFVRRSPGSARSSFW
jgi:hypothetical protein